MDFAKATKQTMSIFPMQVLISQHVQQSQWTYMFVVHSGSLSVSFGQVCVAWQSSKF